MIAILYTLLRKSYGMIVIPYIGPPFFLACSNKLTWVNPLDVLNYLPNGSGPSGAFKAHSRNTFLNIRMTPFEAF